MRMNIVFLVFALFLHMPGVHAGFHDDKTSTSELWLHL